MPKDQSRDAMDYIDSHTPYYSLIQGGAMYHERTDTIIVSYIGEWPEEDQDSLKIDVFAKFQVDVEFQEE